MEPEGLANRQQWWGAWRREAYGGALRRGFVMGPWGTQGQNTHVTTLFKGVFGISFHGDSCWASSVKV